MSHRLRWLGHASWELTTSGGRIILFDPWINGNPKAAVKIEDLKADYILITHDHFDHASDLPAVVEQTGATVILQPETAARYQKEGVPEDKCKPMNIGGSVELDGIVVTMTEAYHSSETGEPAGFIVTQEDGKRVYDAGDTGIHCNMATWAELYPLDVAILPIGGHFTMDPRQAAHALTFLKPKVAIPQHFGTFPLLVPSADDFVRFAREKAPGTEIKVLEPGQSFEF
ncbi:MAG TPA: metal-dependent hydrolase [Thermaerobacter sp.]